MANFTKGNWKLEKFKREERYWVSVFDSEGSRKVVAEINFGFDEPFESQCHANAKLVVSAPKLFKALQELRDECLKSVEYSDWPELQKLVEKADAAIAKASP